MCGAPPRPKVAARNGHEDCVPHNPDRVPASKLPMSLKVRKDRTWGGRGESRGEALNTGAVEGLLYCDPPGHGLSCAHPSQLPECW